MWLRVCGLGFRAWSHADLGGAGLVEVVLVWPVECPGAGVRV